MKTIDLYIGDRLRALVNNPFTADMKKGDIGTIIGFDDGAWGTDKTYACPIIKVGDNMWYTDLKKLFHNFAKEK